MLRMRKRRPASEAGFFVVADRVGQRRGEGRASGPGTKRKATIAGSGSFMGRDLWERADPAA